MLLEPVIADPVGVIAHELPQVMQFGGVQRVGGGQPLAEHINELVEIWGLGHDRDQRSA